MIKKLCFFVVIILLLVACENSIQDKGPQPISNREKMNDNYTEFHDVYISNLEDISMTINEEKQTFHIISAYKLVEEFVEVAKEEDESKHDALWDKMVISNIEDSCLSGLYSHIVTDYIYSAPELSFSLSLNIKELNNPDVKKTTVEALKASAKMFPGLDTTVCLFPQRSDMYFSGVNLDAGKVSIFYSPSLGSSLLKSLIAHEYHHSIWTERYSDDYEWDLLGSIIFEGKAEYFASLVFGQPTVQSSYIDSKQERHLWEKTKELLNSTNPDTINTMLYGGKEDIPYNYGYFLGYQILSAYINRHPKTTIEEWSQLSPKEILEKSNYGDFRE